VNFVLDTNAVSETRKPRPNSGLLDWLYAQDPAHLFITTVTLAEVWHGFHCLPPNHPDYNSIKRFATDLPRKYRVLNFDTRAAAIWGEMTAAARFTHRRHRPLTRPSNHARTCPHCGAPVMVINTW
jgi:predicted nucleic acid-binding protein